MSALIVTIHVIVSITLIMIVLLQTGKGADMGAAFGGGSSQSLFGAVGPSTFLSKATTIIAVVFMLTSLTLAYISTNPNVGSIMPKSVMNVEQKTAIPTQNKGVTAEKKVVLPDNTNDTKSETK